MSFARFVLGGYEEASFRPAVEGDREPPVIIDVDYDKELMVSGEPQASEKPKEGEANASTAASKKRKVESEPSRSKPLKRKNSHKSASTGHFHLSDEDVNQAPENQGYGRGRGKSLDSLRKLPSHDPKVTQALSSEETVSAPKEGEKAAYKNFTDSPVRPCYQEIPFKEGPFVPAFSKVSHMSRLDTEEEREDFVMHSSVPSRLREVELMTNGAFQDYSNETLIRMMSVQVEHLRRFQLLDDEKDRIMRENNGLTRKLRRSEAQEPNGEELLALKDALDAAKGEVALKREDKIKLKAELKDAKKKIAELAAECNERQLKQEETVEKLERFALDASNNDIKMKELSERNESLELSVQKLMEEAEKRDNNWKTLVAGYPQVFKKFLQSCEFAKEMGEVQNKTLAVGGHRGLVKLKSRIPKLDITKLEDYKPHAFQAMVSAGSQLEEKEYPFISLLAASGDKSAEEILSLSPEPFPEGSN